MTHPVPDAALASHLAILGKVGSGKTYAGKGLVERLLTMERRVCIVDPTGVWYGLRSNAAGDGDGFPVVVFGGDHADVPISDGSGHALGEIVADGTVRASIIDLSDFGQGEKHRLMTDFGEELLRRNRAPLHLVLDEADDLAPQNPLPESKRMLGAFDRIVRRGRVKGFRVMLISQRPAVLHKNVLTQANTLIAMRLPAPQDRKAVEEWIKGQADVEQGQAVLASLSRLETGEGWVWSPTVGVLERVKFPQITTYDSSRSPDDEDEGAATEPTMVPVDLAGLRDRLVPPADEETEPKASSRAAVEKARQEGYQQGWAAANLEAAQHFAVVSQRIQEVLGALPATPAPSVSEIAAPALPRHVAKPAAHPRAIGDLSGAAGAILGVLVARHPARFTWQQAATLAGLKARGGHFNAGRKALRESGYIEDGETIAASSAAVGRFGDGAAQPQSPAEILDLWCGKLPAPAPEMLRYVAGQGGRAVSVAELSGALGKQPRGGHWNSGIAVLRNNGLISGGGGGFVPAAELIAAARQRGEG